MTSPVILMLEHDLDDRFIVSSVFEEHQFQAHLEFVNNRNGLFSYLENCRQSGSQYPALVLITLNATPQDGPQILQQLKASNDYKHLPVIILSESGDKNVAQACYALGASSFIKKPGRLDATNEKITNFFKYWFETVELN